MYKSPQHDTYRRNAVRLVRDVTYDTRHEHTKLDVYVPPTALGKETYPTIFFVHGGIWRLSRKDASRFPAEYMAKDGHIVVCPAYHLSGLSQQEWQGLFHYFLGFLCAFSWAVQNAVTRMSIILISMIFVSCFLVMMSMAPDNKIQHPQHIHDVAKALRWTQEHIAEYGGDPDNIIVMGHSAGAHLAALLCTNTTYIEACGLDVSLIKGCVCMSGVYTDKRMKESHLGNSILKNVFGGNVSTHVDAFPIYHVRTSLTPPLMLWGAEYDISLKRHLLDFAMEARSKDVWCEVHYAKDTNHWTICSDWGPGEEREHIWKSIKVFIQQALYAAEHHQPTELSMMFGKTIEPKEIYETISA